MQPRQAGPAPGSMRRDVASTAVALVIVCTEAGVRPPTGTGPAMSRLITCRYRTPVGRPLLVSGHVTSCSESTSAGRHGWSEP